MTIIRGESLVGGNATGKVLTLDEPVSFWGGVDPVSGKIIDRNHPQFGISISDTVLLMAASRGSSSASSVLAEMIRSGTAPAALVLTTRDSILVLGAVVCEELYGSSMPIVMVDSARFRQVAAGDSALILGEGVIEIIG